MGKRQKDTEEEGGRSSLNAIATVTTGALRFCERRSTHPDCRWENALTPDPEGLKVAGFPRDPRKETICMRRHSSWKPHH